MSNLQLFSTFDLPTKAEYESLTDLLVASSLLVGSVRKTRGRVTAGDGGGAYYRIVASDPANGRAWQTSEGLFAELDPLLNGWKFTPEMFGEITGTDSTVDTATMEAMFAGGPDFIRYVFEHNQIYLFKALNEPRTIVQCKNRNMTIEWKGDSFWKMDNGGNYEGFFGPATSLGVAGVTGWRFINPQIDHSASTNTITPAEAIARGRYSLTNYRMTGGAKNVFVEGGKIIDCDSVVSIYFPDLIFTATPDFRNENIFVIGTKFECGIANGSTNYDQSHINIGGENIRIQNCTFTGKEWAKAPVTAIETHGSPAVVTGNTIKRYQIGMNICGIRNEGKEETGILCAGNTIEVGAAGIYLWGSKQNPAQTHTLCADDIAVINNTIRHRWTLIGNGLPRVVGIGQFAVTADPLPYGVVRIEGNTIIYDKEAPRWRPNYDYTQGDTFIAVDPGTSTDAQYTVTTTATSGASFDATEAANYQNDGAPTIAMERVLDGASPSNWGALHFVGSSVVNQEYRELVVKNNIIIDAPCLAVSMEWTKLYSAEINNNSFENCGTSSLAVAQQYQYVSCLIPTITGEAIEYENNKHITGGRPQKGAHYIRNRGVGKILVERNRYRGDGPEQFTFIFSGTVVARMDGSSPLTTGSNLWSNAVAGNATHVWPAL